MIARFFVFVLVSILAVSSVRAQSDSSASPPQSAKQAVRAAIDALFDGMRAGDSTAVRAAFHPKARLHTALGASDTSSVRATPVDAFVKAVGQPHEKVWDERIWDVEIRVDGPLAHAWVPYVFYLGDERSHCGVNAVQLGRHQSEWEILQLTDTRRQDCTVPAEVRKY